MSSRPKKLLVLLLLSLLFCLAACGTAEQSAESPAQAEQSAPAIAPPEKREPAAHPEVKVYFDGLLSDRGYYENNTLYLAPEAICKYFSLEPVTASDSSSFEISFPGLSLTGAKEQEYMIANDRYLYTPTYYIEEKDGSQSRIYLPQDVIERVFGVKIEFSPDEMKAELNYGVLSLIKGGENYYISNFPNEELYWLSRIIYAEAKDQPMEGLIGVGNVVYNRVKSDEFPHTVFDVIFDKRVRVQFDPAATGGVKGEPDERSVIAACLCMEGYNTVGDCMYFVNPDRGDSSWFDKDLEFVISLGDHDFYR